MKKIGFAYCKRQPNEKECNYGQKTQDHHHLDRSQRALSLPPGHQVGDSFDFDTERGKLCPMAAHVAFPYIDILRYGGCLPDQPAGRAVFCCPDVETINVFEVRAEERG